MLRSRIIPCLLIHNNGLVKTVKFKEPKYVGDPLNAVKIFNEKEVDELMVIDIDATVRNEEPNFELIKKLALECRMPFCYGGGVKNTEQAKKIIGLGAEKVAISSAAISSPTIIKDFAKVVGSQSVVVVVDVKRKLLGNYEINVHNAKKQTGINPIEFVKLVEKFGAGEIVINSIDEDGVMKGYDYKIINKIRDNISIPITALGGAGTLEDIKDLISVHKTIGAAAGSLFVFKGVYKAVLINYPDYKERISLYQL